MPDYPNLRAFAALAAGRAELWRTVAGLVMIVVLTATGYRLLGLYLDWRYGQLIAGAIVWTMLVGQSAGGMLMLLYSFLIPAMAVLATTRFLHDRPAGTLFGPVPGQAVRDALRVGMVALGLAVVMLPVALADDRVSANLTLARFVTLLPVALPAIAVQVCAEELIFRGYLQQQLAARFRSPMVWMVLPSALFAAGHFDPDTFGANAPLVAAWSGLFGVLASDLTARTGNPGAAIGLHFATNASALLILGLAGSLDGLALWVHGVGADAGDLPPLLVVDALAVVASWLAARVVLRV